MCQHQSLGANQLSLESNCKSRYIIPSSDWTTAGDLDLRNLPFDLIYNIAATLSIEEFVSFCEVGRPLFFLLDDLFLSGRLVDQWISFAREIKLARQPNALSPAIVERVHKRRLNIAQATPVSIGIIGYGSKFIYSDGFLCFLDGSNLLRVLNIHRSAKTELVFDIHSIVADTVPRDIEFQRYSISPLSCSNGVVIILCELANGSKFGWLVVIMLNESTDGQLNSPLVESVEDTNKLFVRNSQDYVVFGTRTALRSDGHHEWVVKIISLKTRALLRTCDTVENSKNHDPLSLQLRDFAGSDLGTNAAFEIHDGWLYGVANQTSFDLEEVDWTSFYHGFRCRLDNPIRTFQKDIDIYRRQHSEGPINDGWTRLQMQVDEKTGKLMIIESRREWLNGGSKQRRSFYATSFDFDRPHRSVNKLPEDDIMVTQVTSSDNARYERPKVRLHCDVHQEPDPTPASPAFSLTRTKFSTYNASASAFLDLVDDPLRATAATNFRTTPRLRLRIGARKAASPFVPDPEFRHGKLRERAVDPETDLVIPRSEERFQDLPVRLFPSPYHPPEVWQIMNPPVPASVGSLEVDTMADERSLVYMTGPRDGGQRPIVCVNFDPAIVFDMSREGGLEEDIIVSESCLSRAASKARRSELIWNERPLYTRRGKVIDLQPSEAW